MPANARPQRAESDWRCWVLTEKVTQQQGFARDSSSRVDRREVAAANCLVIFRMNQVSVNSSQCEGLLAAQRPGFYGSVFYPDYLNNSDPQLRFFFSICQLRESILRKI